MLSVKRLGLSWRRVWSFKVLCWHQTRSEVPVYCQVRWIEQSQTFLQHRAVIGFAQICQFHGHATDKWPEHKGSRALLRKRKSLDIFFLLISLHLLLDILQVATIEVIYLTQGRIYRFYHNSIITVTRYVRVSYILFCGLLDWPGFGVPSLASFGHWNVHT